VEGIMVNSPKESRYQAIKYILDDDEGFTAPVILNGKFMIRDKIQESLLESKGISEEHIERYIKEKEEEGKPLQSINKEIIPIKPKISLEEAYHKIINILKYYSDLNPRYYNLVALWIIGSYVNESFSTFPYLFINAMRGSGKTRLLKLIMSMARDGQLMTSMTEAVLFRTKGTLAIDEFENLNSKDKTELKELLNASYKKGMKIVRMRKKKVVDGETQEAESFEVFRPIVMANIWGMDEVLGDRCISLQLEKSANRIITRLVENFDEFEEIKAVKDYFSQNQCSLCSVVTKKNIYTAWNTFIYTTTLTTYNTLTTQTTPKVSDDALEVMMENLDLFKKMEETEIDGRNLELFFPLFLIAGAINTEVLDETLDFAKHLVRDRKIDEITESKDVLVYKLVANGFEHGKWFKIHEIANQMKLILGSEGEMDWLNSKWMGRALKRLQLIVDKRRIGDGIEVTLNIEKAKQKTEQFTKEQK
jgi:hypothetical protein